MSIRIVPGRESIDSKTGRVFRTGDPIPNNLTLAQLKKIRELSMMTVMNKGMNELSCEQWADSGEVYRSYS